MPLAPRSRRAAPVARLIALCLALNLPAAPTAFAQQPVDEVNVMIGTTGPSVYDYGGMIPGVAAPFGMTHWTAQTRDNKISVYSYNHKDATIQGFIGTHQPAIWMGDYGQVILMPQAGELKTSKKLPFSHADETAAPNYYSVKMDDHGKPIRAEMTATTRAGFLRFTFPASKTSHVVVTASRAEKTEGFVEVDAKAREITGYNPDRMSSELGPPLPNFKGYFVIQFNKPFASSGTWEGDHTHSGEKRRTGHHVGAYATFPTTQGEAVEVKVGTSFISVEQARDNLRREIPGWNFEGVRAEGRRVWNEALGKIKIQGGSRDERVNFYTAMYHSLLFPRITSEYGRYYSAFDDKIHNGVSYNDYSLWDTFRAEHPLLILIEPERVPGMITSLLQMYDEGGWMPKWPNPTYSNIMIGTHADSVLADAYVKGVRGFDLKKAYEAAYKDAMTPPDGDAHNRWADRAPWTAYEARGGLTWYKSLGYVPIDKTDESVSRTLEFAYDDFCVAQLARAVGKRDDYEMFMKRSRNYKNLYDPAVGFMRAKRSDGSWDEESWASTEDRKPGFTEGSPWTYLFCEMQDIPGMIALLGGDEKFAAKLDENFAGGHYRHDNEPGHHYPYLYDYCGQPWKTQEQVRKVLDEHYHNSPDGLSGNDDCGQMSAWYIFSAMGFYPVTPGSTLYAVGSPLFARATIMLKGPYRKGPFTMIARNQSPRNRYIQSATLNGNPLNEPFIRHSDIADGSTLVFVMGPKPNRKWGLARTALRAQ
ncbi:MAG: GH92 family glycosyl hydrolase [Acidobacteria bacterium]|nr:GH92 family glycosyl hydrolase [Acidobacteriota bacterium]MCA1641652.1 GH92 family glycosyl hydrolase [Acidobacteriota bacterium]